jgi:TonB family protein
VGDSQTLPAELAPLAFRLRQALVPEKRAFDFNAVRPEPVKPQTQVRWSESLLPRLVAAGAELPAVPAGLLNEAGPTVLRLAVLSSGQVGTVLIAASSGKNETDTLAIKSVRQARFEPREGQTVQWGNVSIYWALSAETPTPSPTP